MDIEHLTSAAFWEDEGHFVAGEWAGDLPELAGCGASVIFRTSGSTGEGKWVVLEKKAMRVSARAVNTWLGVGGDSFWGLALPTDHVGGFSILARVFEAGCRLSVFPGKWNAVEFREWCGNEGVTHTSLVPTQLHDLVEASVSAPDGLVAVVIGGGRLSEKLGQAARDLGWPVLASYGMTETASQIATQRLEDLGKSFSDGGMEILPIWKAEVVDGVLSVSGDALFAGTIASGESGFIPRGAGAFRTNDLVRIEGKILKPLGRADSLVKCLGVLVDLEAVERRFLEVAGGRIVGDGFAVVALPDARSEHVLGAVFEGEVKSDCVADYNRQAPGIERIAESFGIPEFPRSSLGKIRRGRLLEMVGKRGDFFAWCRPGSSS